MCVVAIVGSGPVDYLPDLALYEAEVDVWIGADRGALAIVERGITVDYAVGDFDSVTAEEKTIIIEAALQVNEYASEKDATDLEIALDKAYDIGAKKVYLFGITGGRLDHGLINVQLLHKIVKRGLRGIIIDRKNKLELFKPGTYTIARNDLYSYVSFVPFTEKVLGVTLTDFVYPISNYDVTWGQTRLISNELVRFEGMLSFVAGMLLVVQSQDSGVG